MALPLALALALAALMWATGTASGTAWLLDKVPGLTVTAPQGSLLGGFSAERLEVALPGPTGTDRIVIGGLRLEGLSLGWSVAESAWARLGIDRLRADRVDVLLAPDPNAPPLALPQSLRLPLELDVRALDIGELHAEALGEQPLLGLHAQLHLEAGASRLHRIDDLSLAWDRIAVRGAGTIASVAPFEVDARLNIAPRAAAAGATSAPPAAFDASLTARGPLDKLAVEATLRGALPAGSKSAEAPSLDLSASVLPFAAWPLGALQATTRALDLAALHSSAPGTSISGSADVASQGLDRPATVVVALTNTRAGRVDEGLLPLRSLDADIRARPDDPQQIEIHALDLVLGTSRAAGGRLQGRGRWTPQRATLMATLTDIAPSVLDSRAPETRLSGTADLTADGWFESSPRAGTTPSVVVRSRIAGNLPHGGRQERLQLELDATASANRIELRRAALQAGDSRATLAGQAVRQGRGWQVRGQGTLADFNPAQWWPGEDASAWRKGPHRFNGTLELDGLVPVQAGAQGLSLQHLATTQGQATLRVTDSVLAGSPLSGELALRGEGAAGLNVNAALAVAGTKLALRGRLDADARDHWEIDAKAADLATWAPLLRLVQPANAALPALAGALDAQAAFDGRWPLLASTGRVEVKDARAATLRLQRAALRWAVSTALQAPLEVLAEIDQLALLEAPGSAKLAEAAAGGRTVKDGAVAGAPTVQRLDSLRLTVQGTAAEHRITLDAASPVKPPRWIDLLHGADGAPPASRAKEASTGTLAEVKAQGALQFDTAWQKPLRWKGRFEQVDAKRRGGALPGPWFHVGATELDAQYDPLTRTPQVTLSAGRAELPNLALRWSQLRWKGGSAPLLDVQAELEPFGIAPLLARLQPDFGWGGDLVLAGKVNVQSAPTFLAEIEFGRLQGDLHVTDESGTQPLELTDLRVALDARDGVWNFTQALAGKTLGAMAGAAVVRTDARAIWPPAAAPLEGVLEARIANLGSWGAWVPAGWRLRGALHASASFGGRFGAPEYTGQIDGSGLGVRNLLEGVDLHDGELEIALKGETAQIGKLRARAGDGGLQITGDADFGDAPKARLRVVADKMLLLGRVDRRIVTSGDATLQFDPRSLVVDGRFNIDQGLFDFSRGNAPTLGSDVIVIREPVAAVADVVAPRPASARDVNVNLVLNLGSALRVRGRGLDTRLKGELLLTAPNGRLAVNGIVNAVDGTYAAYGQNLIIERGAVTFNGAIENPRLDILALRPNLDIVVGVAITGSASTPRIALYSEPDLPDNDKLSWLVLGRAPEGLQGSDTALLQAAAMALLAGEGDGIGADLARLNPLDTLSVRQTDGEVRDTIVSVGKQLSKRWYIGYERSLTATAGNWQLIYRLAQRFTVRLQTGLDNSIDLIWSWRWD